MEYLDPAKIAASFSQAAGTIWTRQPLLGFIGENLQHWKGEKTEQAIRLPNSATSTQVLNALLKNTALKQFSLDFPYRAVQRYAWKDVTTYEVIQAVDAKGYFSHYTAMHFHGLTDQIPKTAYFNVEQPATGGGGSLTQEGIDRAFKGKCRVTNNITSFQGVTIYKVNGQNTGNLGVVEKTLDDGSLVRVTNLERTLIDIAVRPIYSGGIAEVANAYREAAERVSANRLTTYLRSLNFTYPYHQAIAFYMDKAGNYTEAQMQKLRSLPIEFNFYLTYQIKNPAFNERWKLFVPKGF